MTLDLHPVAAHLVAKPLQLPAIFLQDLVASFLELSLKLVNLFLKRFPAAA